jgi:signal transduction histidine kinase
MAPRSTLIDSDAPQRAAQLEAVIESIPEAVYIGDRSGIKIANGAALRLLGFASLEELNQNVGYLSEALQNRFAATGERMSVEDEPFVRALGGESIDMEVISRNLRTGEDVIQRVVSAPIILGGQIIGAIAVNTDITAQKRAEAERERLLEEARQARHEAEAANRLKDEFLATLSHELRTPLAAVLGWARILRTRALDEKTARALEVIERNAEMQRRLIDDLLDVSSIIANKIQLHCEPIDLVFIAHAALESVRPLTGSRRLALSEAFEPVPPVNGDPQRLQQVISNLLTNAVKFTDPGGTISVAVARAGQWVELTVGDTGIGISHEDLPVIFERFRQVANGTARQGGLGLGLAIVDHVVKLHGGTVRAESEGLGKGARFTLCLPVLDRRADQQRR